MLTVVFAILAVLVLINLLPLKIGILFSAEKRVLRVYVKILFIKKDLPLNAKPKIKPSFGFIVDVLRRLEVEKLHLDTVVGTGDAYQSALTVQFLRDLAAIAVSLAYKKLKKSDLIIKIMPELTKADIKCEFEGVFRIRMFSLIISVLKKAFSGELIKKEEK